MQNYYHLYFRPTVGDVLQGWGGGHRLEGGVVVAVRDRWATVKAANGQELTISIEPADACPISAVAARANRLAAATARGRAY